MTDRSESRSETSAHGQHACGNPQVPTYVPPTITTYTDETIFALLGPARASTTGAQQLLNEDNGLFD